MAVIELKLRFEDFDLVNMRSYSRPSRCDANDPNLSLSFFE